MKGNNSGQKRIEKFQLLSVALENESELQRNIFCIIPSVHMQVFLTSVKKNCTQCTFILRVHLIALINFI